MAYASGTFCGTFVAHMERGKICDRCGGVVDIIAVEKQRADGSAIPARIGACRSCGGSYNEAGLMNLDSIERRTSVRRGGPAKSA
jgi:hypothetical protein